MFEIVHNGPGDYSIYAEGVNVIVGFILKDGKQWVETKFYGANGTVDFSRKTKAAAFEAFKEAY